MSGLFIFACSGSNNSFECSNWEPGAFKLEMNLIDGSEECYELAGDETSNSETVVLSSHLNNECEMVDSFTSKDRCNHTDTIICGETEINRATEIISYNEYEQIIHIRDPQFNYCVIKIKATRQ